LRVVSALGIVGDRAVELGYEELARLPRGSGCGEVEPPPSSPRVEVGEAEQQRSLELTRTLARLHGLLADEDHDEVLVGIQGALLAAELEADAGIQAEVWLLQGQALAMARRWTQAETALQRAWERAIVAGDDDRAAAAALAMTGVSGALGRPREAAGWIRAAEAFASRRQADPLLRARLHVAQVGPLLHAGKTDEARASLEEALALRGEVLGPRAPSVAAVVAAMGDLERTVGRPEQARAHYEQARWMFIDGLGPQRHEVGAVDLRLGALLADTGHMQEAKVVFDRALASFRRSLSPDDPRLADVLLQLGGHFAAMGRSVQAHAALAEAHSIVTEVSTPQDPRHVASLHAWGLAWLREGKAWQAQASLEEALQHAEADLGREHWRLAVILDDLAQASREAGDFTAAMRHHRRAESIWRAQRPSGIELARSLVMQVPTLLGADEAAVALAKVDVAIEILDGRPRPPQLDARAHLRRAQALQRIEPGGDATRREARAAVAFLAMVARPDPDLRAQTDALVQAHATDPVTR
ncbi:MAG: tetratricopeptide repeat protein, partial [Deltaproteobacteria bacterium]|nr:tetratricopeptide repeat protein [Deltaproteobacteria bacterium]